MHSAGLHGRMSSSSVIRHQSAASKASHSRPRHGQARPLITWILIMLLGIVAFLLAGALSVMGILPTGWPEDNDLSSPGLVLRGSLLSQYKRRATTAAATGGEIKHQEVDLVKLQKREERTVTGRQLLSAGVNLALQRIMAARGTADAEKVGEPDLEEPLSLLREARDVLSKGYDGTDETIEKEYFIAATDLALLWLYKGDCYEVDITLDAAENEIDMDGSEKATVALLRGYCEEYIQHDLKASKYYAIAREFDPNVHEATLDARYQPPAYKLSVELPEDRSYFPTLMDLHVFRELYAQRAEFLEGGFGRRREADLEVEVQPWSHVTAYVDDTYGANLGWGLNTDGVERAADLIAKNEFVILREFIHPFELAVLERYYRKRLVNLNFDELLGRAVDYNDRVGNYLNNRYTRLLSRVLRKPVKHAYSFLCHYERRGDNAPFLKPHTDREDNQYTVSIQAYSDKESPLWPIYVDTAPTLPLKSSWREKPSQEKAIECGMRNGDALVFLGRKHIHYRESMPQELTTVASLLLHFVDVAFNFHDYKMVRQKADPSI